MRTAFLCATDRCKSLRCTPFLLSVEKWENNSYVYGNVKKWNFPAEYCVSIKNTTSGWLRRCPCLCAFLFERTQHSSEVTKVLSGLFIFSIKDTAQKSSTWSGHICLPARNALHSAVEKSRLTLLKRNLLCWISAHAYTCSLSHCCLENCYNWLSNCF